MKKPNYQFEKRKKEEDKKKKKAEKADKKASAVEVASDTDAVETPEIP